MLKLTTEVVVFGKYIFCNLVNVKCFGKDKIKPFKVYTSCYSLFVIVRKELF